MVAGFFNGLSAESRRRRFLRPIPRLPEAMLRRLREVDGRRQVAVVADEPDAAEVAVAVAYQGRGIGACWSTPSGRSPVRAGLTTVVYLVDPTNRPALRLLRSLDVKLSLCDGMVEGRQRLPHRPLVTVSSGSGLPPGRGLWRGGPPARRLCDPRPHRA